MIGWGEMGLGLRGSWGNGVGKEWVGSEGMGWEKAGWGAMERVGFYGVGVQWGWG